MDIYKKLSEDLREELKNLYSSISDLTQSKGKLPGINQDIFMETSDQLKEVVNTMENATMNILSLCEQQQKSLDFNISTLREHKKSLTPALIDKLLSSQITIQKDSLKIIENLSFQDLAGQRIKKVLSTLLILEHKVIDIYVASGLMLEDAAHPDNGDIPSEASQPKSLNDYSAEVKNSLLKGPDKSGISQEKVDNLLSQLGL